MFKCKKCGFLKSTDKSKCLCNVKPFNEEKLIKKKDKKPIKQISDKKKERIKTNGSELSFYKKVYKSLKKSGDNICVICEQVIVEYDVTPSCFAHILNKKDYPDLRYVMNNIFLVCGIDDHHKADEAISDYKKEYGLIELEKLIKDGGIPDIKKFIDR